MAQAEAPRTLTGQHEFGLTPDMTRQALDTYMMRLEEHICNRQEWLSHAAPDEPLIENIRHNLASTQTELAWFQQQDPLAIHDTLKMLFAKAQEYERLPLSPQSVKHLLVMEHEAEIEPLLVFIENGLDTKWGYHFSQALCATLGGRRLD